MEYIDDITQLENKLEQIKILDPACGSGAFLVKAVDILLSIYNEIQNFKQEQGAYTIPKKGKKSGSAQQMTFDKNT
jgi:type II restriction/modification system DNA methylase subunit YeeA